MKLFDRFDKVYCINLKRRPDRLENFINQVNKYDLGSYEIFTAVDGNDIDIKSYSTTLKRGELGLILSNIEILKLSIKENFNSILILEDDCIFTDEVIKIDTYFDDLPNNWDMLYMGGNHNTHMGVNPPIILNKKVCKLHTTYSTHFVGISNKIYEKLLSILLELRSPLDVSYVKIQRENNVYSFYPAIAKQLVDFFVFVINERKTNTNNF